MVVGNRNSNFEVTKLKSKFGIQCLTILPALIIRVGAQSGVPLSDGIDVVAILFEVFVTTSNTRGFAVDDSKVPIDAERYALP